MFDSRWTIHRIHKWIGLTAAFWLIILGTTGFLLDHRDTWRWLWQSGVSDAWINNSVVDKSKTSQIRLYQINPNNLDNHITGGLTGLWWSGDDGENWLKTKFIGRAHTPMVSSVFFTKENRVWIASDDGIWLSINNGISASQIALSGTWVSALSINKSTNSLIGVIDKTKLFKFLIASSQIKFIKINPVGIKSLPGSISLSRFTRDIHYGRGVFNIPFSLLWSDITAIAMIVLPLSGFLFYWLPKRWKKNIKRKNKTSHKFKKQSMRWLFRLHGPTFGLISAVPIIYLSLSGILLDHSEELRSWMKSIQITRSWQTPVYDFKSWDGEIYGVIDYKKNLKKISIATRLGLFTSEDNGQSWFREKLLNNSSVFIWTLRQNGENIFIGGMGSPNMVKQAKKPWAIVKKVGHMPSDITLYGKDNWAWKSKHGLNVGNLDTGFSHKHIVLPFTPYVPWFYVIDGLHSGVLIHSQWKWINDLIAFLAIVLVFTGLIRWWRKKWI